MNIHEYQAKELFREFGLTVARGSIAQAHDGIDAALGALPPGPVVVKSQIHAGGRGKGVFVDGFRGGVKLHHHHHEAKDSARRMLGNTLVTHQTGPAGRMVRTILFTEATAITKEYYLAILLDRAAARPVIIASTEGGMDIEQVAEKTPEKILRRHVDPAIGLYPFQARELAYRLGFDEERVKQFVPLLEGLYRLYRDKDCAMVEINPLVLTQAGRLEPLDAKVSFDDNALYRHPELRALRDLHEEDPKEIEASKSNLNYVALDGEIACLVNGAGLAMATMDIIQYYGGRPANFLDVGGGATEEQVTAAFRIILSDPAVKGILVNIFGGIMKCDIIARGIITAVRTVKLAVPLVVRLEGTNVKLGKELLAQSGLAITPADSLADAAQKIVALVKPAP
jgi:succinyl-CoA synthetase beta subunit